MPSLPTHLVFLLVSQIDGCAHCFDIHTRDLLAEGMSIAAMINRMGINFRMKPGAKE